MAERTGLAPKQINEVRAFANDRDSDVANIIGMLLDTGARISEVVGLWVEDIHLNVEVPHVVIHKNPMRRLKTKASSRKIPLVGAALLGATRAKNKTDGQYLFPRYLSAQGLKNDAASAAVNKALKKLDCQTAHWLRHTMRSRLRNADVPDPRVKEIQGWGRESVADQYGEQTALSLMQKDLKKAL